MFDTTAVERICVPGPGGINVEVSDEVKHYLIVLLSFFFYKRCLKVVASWRDESVFDISITKGVCRLEPATHKRSSKGPKYL